MGEKVKAALGKVKSFFGKLGRVTKIIIATVLIAILIFVIVLVIRGTNKEYAVLFTGLNSTDMSSVVTYLEDNDVTDYKIKDNDTILVPAGQEDALKAAIAMEEYPDSGFGYSTYFDNIGMLSTDSDRKQLILYDLQDRLGAVIRNFEDVKDANVTIAEGSDNRYILNDDDVISATASVEVIMKDGESLTSRQVAAIQNLVSHAVSGLEIDNVSIVDSAGNSYTSDETLDATDASELKLALEAKVNNTVRLSVLNVLTPIFGADNISVSVISDVDVSRTYTDTTTYGDGSYIGTRVWDNSMILNDDETAGGTVGTTTNADLNEYMLEAAEDGAAREYRASGEEDYNVDTNHVQSDNASGIITDLMVAVSINSDVADNVNTDNLVALVARAAKISTEMEDEKVSIFYAPFYTEPSDTEPGTTGGMPSWVIYALIGGLILFLLLLLVIVLLVYRSKQKKKKKQAAEAAAAAAAAAAAEAEAAAAAAAETEAPANQGLDIMELDTDRSIELRKEVRQFVQDNPEIAAQMVRSWLKGGGDTDGS